MYADSGHSARYAIRYHLAASRGVSARARAHREVDAWDVHMCTCWIVRGACAIEQKQKNI